MKTKLLPKLRLLACFAFLAVASVGCSTTKNYSINSYPGPLPMDDYIYIERPAGRAL